MGDSRGAEGGPGALYRSTLHGEPAAQREQSSGFRPLDPTNRPAPLKRYDVVARPLSTSIRRSTLPATAVLSGHRGNRSELDLGLLGTLLHLMAGVTRVAGTPSGEPMWFRAAMSAGNLHPVEIYVAAGGIAHYQPLEHALVPLREPRQSVDAVRARDATAEPTNGAMASIAGTGAATLVLTGIPFRTCWKYGERGWRHLWWDAGCLLANLLALAGAHGLAAGVTTAFADDEVASLVGINGIDEVPLALVHLGPGEPSLPTEETLTPITARPDPIARDVLRFPLVVGAQAGSALSVDEVAPWRDQLAAVRRPAPETVEPPTGADPADRIEDVILRRGSTRVFRPEPGRGELLSWGLAAATRDAPFDAASPGTLLEQFVNVHAIAGLDPGGYRYAGQATYEGRTRAPDARPYGARLCLDQPLGGDSVYTVFHAADLQGLSIRLGGRAYRVALLEAGLVAGRLALDAVALGYGATGLTFYDQLVGRYFRTDTAPLLATAVGIPATEPAPSGTPGNPVELGGYSRVMARLASTLHRGRVDETELQ